MKKENSLTPNNGKNGGRPKKLSNEEINNLKSILSAKIIGEQKKSMK
ncbi:hypothetical protein [Methanotorris formicicus]